MTSRPRKGVLILTAVLALSGCAAQPALTPSELNAHADLYNGKQVHVRAWLVYQFENIGLWDSQSAYEKAPGGDNSTPSICVSYLGPDLGKHYVSRMVVLTGTFRKDLDHDPNHPDQIIVSNGWCNNSGLEIGH